MLPLTLKQRYQIEFLSYQLKNYASIARVVGCDRSTISREFNRNSMNLTNYDAESAHAHATRTRVRSPRISHETWNEISSLIENEQLSPKQVRLEFARQGKSAPSHETIYQRIYNNPDFAKCVVPHLRRPRTLRQNRANSNQRRGMYHDAPSIHDRPPEAEARSRFGDCEVDTVIGQQGGPVLVTIVDRMSRKTWIGKAHNKTAGAVTNTIVRMLESWKGRIHTLTFDRGTEFANYQWIAYHLGVKCYFADPYSPWQRGTNENTNGLIRQYFPKGTNLSHITETKIHEVESKLNRRPKEVLGGRRPNDLAA